MDEWIKDELLETVVGLRRVVESQEVLNRQLARDFHELRQEFFSTRGELWRVIKELQGDRWIKEKETDGGEKNGCC